MTKSIVYKTYAAMGGGGGKVVKRGAKGTRSKIPLEKLNDRSVLGPFFVLSLHKLYFLV